MICHLSDIDIKWLLKEYLVLIIVNALKQAIRILMSQKIVNVTINFDNGYSRIFHKLHL
jgi:hypothetical protein